MDGRQRSACEFCAENIWRGRDEFGDWTPWWHSHGPRPHDHAASPTTDPLAAVGAQQDVENPAGSLNDLERRSAVPADPKGRTVWLAWHGSWDSRYLIGVYATRAGAVAALEEANADAAREIEALNEDGRSTFKAEFTTPERGIYDAVVGP